MTPESPFSPVYSRPSFLETPGSGEALRRLDDGLGAREPFLLLTGEPGIGKTALANEAVARWGARVTAAFVAYPAMSGAEFLEEIIRRFGAEPPEVASRPKLVACFERALAEIAGRGQVAALVVDDAHALPVELLEELRLLVNAAQQARRPLEVLLIGLPELEVMLDRPRLAALRQRVSVHAKIEPLSPSDTRHYLHHRINAIGGNGTSLFSRKICREIAARTGGVPRQINALAAESLRVLRAWGDPTVGPEHVQTAAAALGGFVPSGEIDGADDSGAEDSPAAAASARIAIAPVVAEKPAAVAAAPSAPKPAAVAATVAPAPPAPKPVAVVAATAPPTAKPASPAPVAAKSAPPAAPAKSAAPAPVAAKSAPPAAPAKSASAGPQQPAASTRAQASAPPAKAAAPAAANHAADAPPIEESTTRIITPAENHDPREWVARFVGEQGPLQLSSRAYSESSWEPDPSVELDGEAATGEAPPKPRGHRDHGRPRSHSRHRGGARVATTALLAVLVVGAGVVLVMRSRVLGLSRTGSSTGAAATAAASPMNATPVASSPAVTRSAVANAPAPAASRASARAAEPRATSSDATPHAPTGEAGAESAIANAKGPFAIDVGSVPDLSAALDQRDRLQSLTGFQGWIVPAAGGGGPYRVVLGAYRSYARAAGAARMLVHSKTLGEANVVPLPPKSERQ